ncbi:HAMP domain-containing sensor histidine kinase [Undibacterium sp. TS12]|uniref:sensor histidine kinase n=1 Tax=Undibacterium sp. TS12 TaxID=2908202 RepID=UPI001F4C5A39|nr:HAMP domain-containing sensor histidine kinase [Undibacterium sp. TS12]MCH8618140.1 HAMP domain-containing histidine kinase [Undibacterium sp. TS12]
MNNLTRLRSLAIRCNTWVHTYRLTIQTAFFLLALVGLSSWGLYVFIKYSATKARNVQSELFERDLRDLVNHFDTDERFVLDRNLANFLLLDRAMGPLLLPRLYYISLPSSNSRTLPRQPPRNCFVNLKVKAPSEKYFSDPDRFCSYFVENQGLGNYVFLNIELSDDSITPLKQGDISLSADSLEIEFSFNKLSAKWRLLVQSIGQEKLGRYELTAFRKKINGVVERDRRLEAWGYVKHQNDGHQKMYVLARLDIKEFLDQKTSAQADAIWPPTGWESAKFSLSRYDYSHSNQISKTIEYEKNGETVLSIPSLATPFFSARASIDIIASENGILKAQHRIFPPQMNQIDSGDSYLSFIDGDILIRKNPLVRKQPIPDTNLSLEVRHPGLVVEKSALRVFNWLLFLAISAIITVAYFSVKLLLPVFNLSRFARRLARSNARNTFLPYDNRKDEIGILAKAFNELISRVKEQVEREIRDASAREADENLRREIAVRNKEENLNIIGHEIRSPLQALISLHAPATESRRHLDRILAALPHLQQGLSPEDAINSRKLNLEAIDMVVYMAEIAANVALINIPNVIFVSDADSATCLIDSEAFEDVIDKVIQNADRHREKETPIIISVKRRGNDISIEIKNTGPQIPMEIIEKIFDFGVSTSMKVDGQTNGVGLWIARSYLAKMRGRISAKNVDDCKVVFEIILPEIKSVAYPDEIDVALLRKRSN